MMAETAKNKLLILGAGKFQFHLIEKAREMGNYVIVISPDGDYPGLLIADKVYYHDATDKEYVLDTARKEQVNGIISDQAEIFVGAIAYATDILGLPGNSYESALIYTNKHKMRQRTKEIGLPTIKNVLVPELSEAKSFYKNSGCDVIIKPVDSFSSRGVYKICCEEDLDHYFEKAKAYSPSDKVIVEQFIEGRLFEVDSIAVNGEIETLMYADLDEFNIPNVFSSRTRLYPSDADPALIKRLLEFDKKVNQGFGLVQGLTHNEYIVDSKTDEIYLIEAALRGGGSYIGSHIAILQTGLDTAEFLVKIALGQISELPQFEKNRCNCGYVTFYLPEGEIVSRDGADEVDALPYVVKTTLADIRVGNTTSGIADKEQRHIIVLYADTRDALLARIDYIKDMLKISIRTSQGIEKPIWN